MGLFFFSLLFHRMSQSLSIEPPSSMLVTERQWRWPISPASSSMMLTYCQRMTGIFTPVAVSLYIFQSLSTNSITSKSRYFSIWKAWRPQTSSTYGRHKFIPIFLSFEFLIARFNWVLTMQQVPGNTPLRYESVRSSLQIVRVKTTKYESEGFKEIIGVRKCIE